MIDGVIAFIEVLYLAVGWYIADLVDTENILLIVLVVLFWPLIVVLALFTLIFFS